MSTMHTPRKGVKPLGVRTPNASASKHKETSDDFPNLKNLINIVKLSEYKAKKLQTEEKRRQELAEQFPHLFSAEKVSRIKQQRSDLLAPSLKPNIEKAAAEVDENCNQNIETPRKQWNKKRVDRTSRHTKKRLSRKLQLVIDDLHATTAIDADTHKRLSLENQRLFPTPADSDEAEDEVEEVSTEEKLDVVEALRNYLEKRHNVSANEITSDAAPPSTPVPAETTESAPAPAEESETVVPPVSQDSEVVSLPETSLPTAVPVNPPVSFTSLLTQALLSQRVSSAITRYRVVGDHVMYEIRLEVARSTPNSTSNLMHMMLLRRYSDFAALTSTLTKLGHCPGALPPRQLMPQFRNRWKDPQFLESRQAGLDSYLTSVLATAPTSNQSQVADALLQFITTA